MRCTYPPTVARFRDDELGATQIKLSSRRTPGPILISMACFQKGGMDSGLRRNDGMNSPLGNDKVIQDFRVCATAVSEMPPLHRVVVETFSLHGIPQQAAIGTLFGRNLRGIGVCTRIE